MRTSRIAALLILGSFVVTPSAVQARRAPRSLPASPPVAASPSGGQIAGDDIASAIVIPSLPFSTAGNTCGFAADYLIACSGLTSPDLVHAFTPSTDMQIRASLCGTGFDSYLALFDGSESNLVVCMRELCDTGTQLSASLTAGHTYYFVVSGDSYTAGGVDCGAYTLSIAPVVPQAAGETIANAFVIPALPFSTTGGSCVFVSDYELACVPAGSPDVVYRFSPVAPICVDVSLCGSGYDTALTVFRNTPADVLACDDDGCLLDNSTLESRLSGLQMLPGNTYYVVVSGYEGECGEYALAVQPCGWTRGRLSTWGQVKHSYR